MAKRLTDDELAYIARFYKWDGAVQIGKALERPAGSIKQTYYRMLFSGEIKKYLKMWNDGDVNYLERR